jgi:tetratricopeptide (TPR) repeat protein
MRIRSVLAFLALAPFGIGATAEAVPDAEAMQARDLLAIVTDSAGEVSFKERGGDGWQPARTLQGLTEGTALQLGTEARLTLLCSNGGVLELVESGVLSGQRCRQARQWAPGRFAALVPDGGRLKGLKGSWTLEGETRDNEADYGLRPVILAPRCPLDEAHRLGCSRLLRLPSSIRWAAVEKADRYSLRLNGFDDVTVAANEVTCDESSDGVSYRACSLAWPEAWRLEQKRSYFLQIEARTGLFDKETSEKTRIELLAEDEAAAVERELAEIAEIGLDSVTERLLEAIVLNQRGLVNGSLAALQSAVGERPDGLLRVALGDAYRRVDLLYPALRQYEQVLAEPDTSPEVRAAAELGLGWVYDRWRVPDRALTHLESARALYAELGLAEEAGIAQRLIDGRRK